MGGCGFPDFWAVSCSGWRRSRSEFLIPGRPGISRFPAGRNSESPCSRPLCSLCPELRIPKSSETKSDPKSQKSKLLSLPPLSTFRLLRAQRRGLVALWRTCKKLSRTHSKLFIKQTNQKSVSCTRAIQKLNFQYGLHIMLQLCHMERQAFTTFKFTDVTI